MNVYKYSLLDLIPYCTDEEPKRIQAVLKWSSRLHTYLDIQFHHTVKTSRMIECSKWLFKHISGPRKWWKIYGCTKTVFERPLYPSKVQIFLYAFDIVMVINSLEV